ncbi:hypothetical protein BJ170DRAFT_628860 [Xylariales sp. AK1849]|nr:hypothetical protein BJ170DRAFT_628860 [Xylariales sp. AK1849]
MSFFGRDDNDNDNERRGERREDYGGNKTSGGSYPAGGYGRDDDLRGSAGDSDLFSSLLGKLGERKESLAQEDVDTEDAVQQHRRHYGDGDDSETNDRSIGSAAAVQALKSFTSGGSGNSQQGNSQSAFVKMAMQEAGQLFNQKQEQGKVSSDSSQQSAMMQAGEMALKMYMKSNGQSSSGLLGLASKFL